jgi:hypothetical protein
MERWRLRIMEANERGTPSAVDGYDDGFDRTPRPTGEGIEPVTGLAAGHLAFRASEMDARIAEER